MIQDLRIKLNKICEWALYLFVFLLPWQTRWIIYNPMINETVWEYGRISLYAFDVVFIVLSILYFVLCIKNKYRINKFVYSFTPLLLYSFISILWADYKILSFYWSLRILQGILLIWILSRIDFSKIKLAWAFIVSMTLSAGLGIYQFLTQSAFASKWLGVASHSAGILGDSVVEIVGGRWLRAYGGLSHPNVLAGLCVVAILVCVWLYHRTQNTDNRTQEKNKILLITYYLLLITALFFTFSRAAWIIYIIIVINLLIKKIAWRPIVASLVLILILGLLFAPLVKTRFYEGGRLEINSNTERVAGHYESFEVIKNNLWLGTGIGNYTYELQKINPGQSASTGASLDGPAWAYQPVHNIYLLVLSEVGVIGVLLIAVLLCFLLREIRNWKLEIRNFVFMFLYFYIFMFLFDHFWWTLGSGMLVWWIMVALFIKNTET